jgi:hypothetical protein
MLSCRAEFACVVGTTRTVVMVAELRKNFRDVGATIDCLIAAGPAAAAGARLVGDAAVAALPPLTDATPVSGLLPRGRILRCGRVDFCTLEELGSPRTIINLRIDADEFPDGYLAQGGAVALHCPAEDRVEKYDTSQNCVRQWIVSVLKHLERPDRIPALVHCKHGRDRTGIIVAALLAICDVPVVLMRAEYELSEGCCPDLFELTLAGFGLVPAPVATDASGGKPSKKGRPFNAPAKPSDAMVTYLRGLVDVGAIRQALLR